MYSDEGPLHEVVSSSRYHIIIIMPRCEHVSPWPSLATRLYRPSLPEGLQGYIRKKRIKTKIIHYFIFTMNSTKHSDSVGEADKMTLYLGL